jgi:hypothetical protein
MDAENLIVHVRFAPNGRVVEISERPGGLDPHAWFDFLSDNAGDVYQTLAGGRGVFRLTREAIEALKVKAAA